jgi:hypothetical protein
MCTTLLCIAAENSDAHCVLLGIFAVLFCAVLARSDVVEHDQIYTALSSNKAP